MLLETLQLRDQCAVVVAAYTEGSPVVFAQENRLYNFLAPSSRKISRCLPDLLGNTLFYIAPRGTLRLGCAILLGEGAKAPTVSDVFPGILHRLPIAHRDGISCPGQPTNPI